MGSGLAASRPRRQAARISMAPGAITARLSVQIDGYPANDYFYQYGPLPGDMRCTNPDEPERPDPGALEGHQRNWGLHQSEIPSRVFRLQGPGACPMAAPSSSSATRARRCPRRRRRRRHAYSGSSAIRGYSTPRAQWARRPNSPARAPRGRRGHREVSSSSGSMVISAMAAGATVAAATAQGGGGGGGGLGGEAGTCASDLTVGTNTTDA